MKEQLHKLFHQWAGTEPEQAEPLARAGSNRSYFRFHYAGHSAIGVTGSSDDENRAFVTLARHFAAKNLPVPEIFAVSDDYGCYLQEDLGNLSLFDAIAEGRISGNFSAQERELLCNAMTQLPRFQFEGAEGLDFSVCYPQPAFDRRMILWDLNYFKYCFLKLTGLEFHDGLLEDDFETLADELLAEEFHTFMYRDFQSRNVILKAGKPCFIDFQGGRRGPIYYDVASFIGQAKANFPDNVKEELLQSYLKALQPYRMISEKDFREKLQLFSFFRALQTLGAYGFRGYAEHKSHFIQSIPFAIAQLRTLLEKQNRTPYLRSLLKEVVAMKKFQPLAETEGLAVTITSFSFHKGIPEDLSGNGGGFVFDCRALSNPGRYEEYRPFTGLDRPVIDFFDKNRDIFNFIEEAKPMINRAVETYQKRGFKNLMLSFGCTGGQHRSVFSAQRIAEYLSEKYGIRVVLNHRELGKEQIFPPQTPKRAL